MACFRPLLGYRSALKNPDSGKRSIVFNAKEAYYDFHIQLPCGQCIGCRLERSRQWAVRMMHEASLYERNCFITLTYRPGEVPKEGLRKKDFQDFMKRLRKRFGKGPRYFHCGEYGENFSRPHYHAVLFNHDFDDKYIWRRTKPGNFPVWRSEALEELWPHGFSEIGSVTFESAAYVARYVTKKVTGDRAIHHYSVTDDFGNVALSRTPEYATMSRRPGISNTWIWMHWKDVYPDDQVVLRGQKMRPPKYYDSIFDVADPIGAANVKARRRSGAKRFDSDIRSKTYRDFDRGRIHDRLAVLERIQELRFVQLKRGYESDDAESFHGL